MMMRPSRGRWDEAIAAARRFLPANIQGEAHPAWVDIRHAFHR
jgi:hypothetical protein